MIKSYRDLKVYDVSYAVATDVFWVTKGFPKEEIYSLTDQLRRASRSVVANIVEGWAKRAYENLFKRHLVDAAGSCQETVLWLDFARDCGYLSEEEHRILVGRYDEIGKMLHTLTRNWKTRPASPESGI